MLLSTSTKNCVITQVFGNERSWAYQIIKHFINQSEQCLEVGC